MLTDYDAEAVAAALGIAFVADSAGGAVPAKRGGAAGSAEFVVMLGDDPVRVVQAEGGARPSESLAAARHTAAGGRGRVWPPSPLLMELAVARGFPRLVVRHVAELLAGGDAAKVPALERGVVSRSSRRRRAQLSPGQSERTERVARLFVHARRALGTEDEARHFMTAPHPELEGRSPVDAARTDLGTRRVEQILSALEHGLAL
jgi:putative toxin-antitoxin system antitoxin component (TIGR02293 family)